MAALTFDPLAAIVEEYAEAAQKILTTAGRPASSVIPIAPGVDPAWDDKTSQLYGRFVQALPGTAANVNGGNTKCGIPWYSVTLGLALTRCVASITVKGNRPKLPSPAEVAADGMTMLADLAVLESVVRCGQHTYSLISANVMPETGAMAGVEVVYAVRVMTCACPPPED